MTATMRYAKPVTLVQPFGTELIPNVIQIQMIGRTTAILTYTGGSTEQIDNIDRFTIVGFIDYP